MPRQARKKSESGIYHIILRGNNRQKIFKDEEDHHRFLQTLKRYKEISGYELYAYCLMGNHVHLLLRSGKEPLEQLMRRLCSSYVHWYNKKYERIGNLFQDRFKSEPVEDDAYFLTVLRYIHQNPCEAGLINDIAAYSWSSYRAYLKENSKQSSLADVDFGLNMFGEDTNEASKRFADHHEERGDDVCLEVEEIQGFSDREAREIIQALCQITSCAELQQLDRKQRDGYLKQLKEEYNLPVRQLERLTGVSRSVISRA